MTRFLFYGDPHGQWQPLRRAVAQYSPAAVILLGDMDLDEPLEKKLDGFQEIVWWIPGNHDGHSEQRSDWYDNLFHSGLADRNLSGRVLTISGLKVAGLGGHFQQTLWHPHTGLKYRSRAEWLYAHRERWRDGLPISRRVAIWWEDYESLHQQSADILVTHEAPSSHRYGFAELDELASAMGARFLVHGHHHETYTAQLHHGSIQVFGAAKATPVVVDIAPAVRP